MATLLEKALDELRKCSPGEQDAIAALILEEIADDRRWDEAFAASTPALEKMAEKVQANIRAGHTRDIRADDLQHPDSIRAFSNACVACRMRSGKKLTRTIGSGAGRGGYDQAVLDWVSCRL
jgi:hypothetical protein